MKLKKYVGTERITARRMRQDPVSFRPSHTMVVTTNYRPVVTDTDHGTWRRLRMVPFSKTYGRDGLPVDRGLRSRLMDGQAQQEAVLAWLVEGARLWLAAGLELPEQSRAIKEATQAWRESTDLIYAFASDRLVDAAGEYVEVEACAKRSTPGCRRRTRPGDGRPSGSASRVTRRCALWVRFGDSTPAPAEPSSRAGSDLDAQLGRRGAKDPKDPCG